MHCYNLQPSPHILFSNLLSLFPQNYSAINLDILSIAGVIVAETWKKLSLQHFTLFKIIFHNKGVIRLALSQERRIVLFLESLPLVCGQAVTLLFVRQNVKREDSFQLSSPEAMISCWDVKALNVHFYRMILSVLRTLEN